MEERNRGNDKIIFLISIIIFILLSIFIVNSYMRRGVMGRLKTPSNLILE